MALYHYVPQATLRRQARGSLSIKIPSTSITSANVEVRRVVNQDPASRVPYAKFIAEQRAIIRKQTAGAWRGYNHPNTHRACRFAHAYIWSKGVANNINNLIS